MSVMCSTCGRLSQDPEFCDHCNADLGKAGQSLPPERCPLEAGGLPLTKEQRHVLIVPESSIQVHADGHGWRVHWIANRDWVEGRRQYEKRLALQIPALPAGRLLDDPEQQGRWLVFQALPHASFPWQQSALPDLFQELQRLSAAVHSLTQALTALHQNSLLWLNFDPNAIEDAGPMAPAPEVAASAGWRRLRITNLDVELFPFQSMPERVRVHPHYAAPEVVQFRVEDIGPRTDVYHLAVFAYYWLAGKLPDGLPGGGLEDCDYTLPFLRIFTPYLPEGILPVVMRGLSQQPNDRQATPQAFAGALDDAIIQGYRRRAFTSPLQWDVGGFTCAGRSKTELQRGNEDTVLVKDDNHGALVLVADGVSTCDVGSGGLASMMTAIIVENALADGCTHDTFPVTISSATQRGSQGLLEWALAHHGRADLEAGKDLMGTTLTVGWLEGHEISLANLGDSRAYLLTAGAIEQLTVDGDLASDLLSRGASPEEVRELGMMSRALRECVGGCTKTLDGKLSILPESCTPTISRWPLMPGDIVILCTDGLVEEGYFLEPETLAEVVRNHKHRSAADLARMLVEAADAMQRVPTILEPDGFGDNISCVVVKIKSEPEV